ncbi:DNA-binding CsgD family transcriptional regulator [Sinobacterium caligoides]|uniref:DNA-binding CsgD family transcriptional regulator n=1 Tax=Sinobacterium caligoides TaxID=933926 RepID=A0A3N2DMX0_9GAMM|nr:LuxR C-terminal-related transcriptional regulator [Sinobacterium caligoides]ROS01157.1 DNA-binding CsgD family transcriptional regulator [Sinobacterium caligoides]
MSQELLASSYSDLIDAIYRGPLERTPWQSFLTQFKNLLDCKVVALVRRFPTQSDRGLLYTIGGDEHLAADYRNRLYAVEPQISKTPNRPVYTLDELANKETMIKSDFFQKCLAPSNIAHLLCADTFEHDGTNGRVLQARLCAAKIDGTVNFTEEEKQICELLLPHLQRALMFHKEYVKVEAERALYEASMGQLGLGTIILDENGRLIKSNSIANNILNERDGLVIEDDKLLFSNRENDTVLQQAIERCRALLAFRDNQLVEALRVQRPSGHADLGILIKSVNSAVTGTDNNFIQGCPSIAIFISDPEQQSATGADILRQLYGLTNAEANLALLILEGMSVEEAAGHQGVSKNTVKTHLKSLYAKTGVSKQTRLVRLLSKSVASLG